MNVSGMISSATGASLTPAEKNKQWQRELLMERIRSHSSQHRSFPELSKSMRMSMLEKRYALDAVEKSNLQKCLDSMQDCIKVTSRQGLVERLESLSRQLGLKFMEDTSGLFISTDMFYLEIILDANGSLTDVKVHHECKIEQQSCSELVNCLNRGDFADFTIQLEGLSSIYQLNAEPKIKTKAFVALQAMETDLYNLFQMQHFSKDTQAVVADSIVGVVLKRRGGHPMKLTYFVSSYDLINIETKSMQQLTIDLITSSNIGMSVTVNLEASSTNKLQILPTVSFVKDQQGQSDVDVPIYSPLTQLNSALLPATFVLRLNKPLPVCYNTLRMILPQAVSDIIGMESKSSSASSFSSSFSSPAPIMNLLVQTASDNQIQNSSKGLFVSLPDQTHCYFFTENKHMQASLLSSVPFTEPAEVPKILSFLKQQALFYTLLASCIRPQSKMGDMDSTTIIEVNAISFQQISVALEHPYEESMATVDFNLSDTTVICNIYSMNSTEHDLLSAKLTKIIQKCLSIPVTIRSLLKQWDEERMKMYSRITPSANEYGSFSLMMGPSDPGGRSSGSGVNSSAVNSSGGTSVGGNMIGSNGNSAIKTENLAIIDRSGGSALNNSANGNNFVTMNRQFFHSPEGFPELGSGGGGGGGGSNIGSLGVSGAIASNIGSSPSAVAAAGILKQFKNEIKQEDFCKSPKSNQPTMQFEFADSSSLGECKMQQFANAVADNTNTYGVASSSSTSTLSLSSLATSSNFLASSIVSTSQAMVTASTTATAMNNQLQQQSSIETSNQLVPTEESMKFTERSTDIAEKYQKIWKDKTAMKNTVSITPILSGDLSNSRSQASLTSCGNQSSGVETKRPGIEIIPLTTSTNSTQSSSTTVASASLITITPINSIGSHAATTYSTSSKNEKKTSYSSSKSNDSNSNSSTSSSNSSNTKSNEKKRKRKREDSPMRPPEKIFSRQNSPATDALTMSRKFSSPQSSPKSAFLGTTNNGGGNLGSTSTLIASPSISPGGNLVLPSPKPSPKHSPVYSSPKHLTTMPSSSPKSPFGTSPKHGSSGKPSMSTLKSATASSSPKNEKNSLSNISVNSSSASSSRSSSTSSSASSSSTVKNREKDGKERNSSLSPQLKNHQSANKSITMKYSSGNGPSITTSTSSTNSNMPQSGRMASGSSSSMSSSLGYSGTYDYGTNVSTISRKGQGSLSAVIDKLKSAHNPYDDDEVFSTSTTSALSNCQVNLSKQVATTTESGEQQIHGNSNQNATLTTNTGSSEYMVKPSHDGMKITINKTKSQSSGITGAAGSSSSSMKSKSIVGNIKSFSSNSGAGTSPVKKPHTGLKPGVNSGPASKKASSASLSPSYLSAGTSLANKSNGGSNLGAKCGFQKSNSSGCLSIKSSAFNSLTKSQSTSSFTTESFRPSSSSLSKVGNSSSMTSLYQGGSGGGGGGGNSSKKSSNLSAMTSSLNQNSSASSHFPVRSDPHADMMKILQYASPNMALDGFMKTFNTKFQIPKLSARLNSTTATTTATTNTAAATLTTTTTATTTAKLTTPLAAVTSTTPTVAGITPSTSTNCEFATTMATTTVNSDSQRGTTSNVNASSIATPHYSAPQQQQNYPHVQGGGISNEMQQLTSKKYPITSKATTADYHHSGLQLKSLTQSTLQPFPSTPSTSLALNDSTKSATKSLPLMPTQSSLTSVQLQQQQQIIDDHLVGVGVNK